MIKEEIPQQDNQELNKKEKILANPAFRRFAGGFQLYQELINRGGNEADRDLIITRMRELYKPNPDDEVGQQAQASKILKAALAELILPALRGCEENKFDIDRFAEKICRPPLYDLFSAEWNRSADEVEEESGMIHVNELIAYKEDADGVISLHIRPTGIESKDLMEKVKNGFKSIKELLESDKLKADRIIMKSWMLGGNKQAEIVPSDDEQYESIQFLALQYNRKSLRKYLETGEKPEVRQMIMTKEEFLRKI